ncbi:hypothetical protein M758_UG206000 [Ceratodon purpureus]|nr:hypothetical protein M758_UG206000 [Ceratodon purpureus]
MSQGGQSSQRPQSVEYQGMPSTNELIDATRRLNRFLESTLTWQVSRTYWCERRLEIGLQKYERTFIIIEMICLDLFQLNVENYRHSILFHFMLKQNQTN